MHDIKLIREKPDWFDAQLARRGLGGANIIRGDDTHLRALKTKSEGGKATLNDLSGSIGRALKNGDQAEAKRLKAEVAHLKSLAATNEAEQTRLEMQVFESLGTLPNLPADDVPDGNDEADNVVVHKRGSHTSFNFPLREHFDFCTALGLDFESAQTVSGARFAYLRRGIARLARALGQFMLDIHTTEFGYEEVAPPLLVRDEAMFGTGQLPKFSEDSFKTTDGRWLIPTAEVSLTNLVRDRILAATDLPLRFAALTPCFRSEAGAAGRDTRGLVRQHQFDKVELVSIVTPEASETEHERMTHAAETILDRLALPYRRMLLCVGDMGFTARKTYDLEVWLPGQDRYREISSCSNCGDFQARRMNARFRRASEKGTTFVHTLNGSGVAVGRALVAVMENYQQENGGVVVPDALLPYMGGLTRLDP